MFLKSGFLHLYIAWIFAYYMNTCVVLCILFLQEEEDETDAGEEMFHTHKDSKPNGILVCNKLIVQFDEFQGIDNIIWLNIFVKQFLIC